MRFEWDPQKNRTNRTRHNGLDFATAARVFDDPNVILVHDRIVEGEQRWHAIGAVSAAVLLVVYTYREDDINGKEIIRVIPAREANQRECRIYFSTSRSISGKRRY